MKNKLYKAMAAVLAVGVCLMPSTMAQAAETDENALLYSFPVQFLPYRDNLTPRYQYRSQVKMAPIFIESVPVNHLQNIILAAVEQ